MSYIIRTGNLAGTPELRTSESGKQFCHATVIVNDRQRQDDGSYTDTGKVAYRVTAFGSAAENLAQVAATSGNIRIVFAGRYSVREYARRDGGTGISHDVVADELGVSLAGQTIAVDRNAG